MVLLLQISNSKGKDFLESGFILLHIWTQDTIWGGMGWRGEGGLESWSGAPLAEEINCHTVEFYSVNSERDFQGGLLRL